MEGGTEEGVGGSYSRTGSQIDALTHSEKPIKFFTKKLLLILREEGQCQFDTVCHQF